MKKSIFEISRQEDDQFTTARITHGILRPDRIGILGKGKLKNNSFFNQFIERDVQREYLVLIKRYEKFDFRTTQNFV